MLVKVLSRSEMSGERKCLSCCGLARLREARPGVREEVEDKFTEKILSDICNVRSDTYRDC